jgi:hypothetical protein
VTLGSRSFNPWPLLPENYAEEPRGKVHRLAELMMTMSEGSISAYFIGKCRPADQWGLSFRRF